MALDLALCRFEGIADEFCCVFVELRLQVFMRLPLGLLVILRQVLKQSSRANDVSFLELSVVLTIFLNGVVCELHKDLLLVGNVWVVGLVLLAACADVRLAVDVDLLVEGGVQGKDPNVELTLQVKAGKLNQLLDNEGKVAKLLFTV